MEIKYYVYWKTDKNTTRVASGVLTTRDLEEAVRLKEEGRERISGRVSIGWGEVKL